MVAVSNTLRNPHICIAITVAMAALVCMCCLLAFFLIERSFAAGISPTDLSHYYDKNTIAWAGYISFNFSREVRSAEGQPWYAGNEFETAEHCGTHLDAPYHFNPTGWHVGEIPFERFFAHGVVMDFRNQSVRDPDYRVTAEDLEMWEKANGPIPNGSVVLLDFNWTGKYSNKSAYLGTDKVNDSSTYHFPGLSEKGAKWLAETGRVFGVGTDTASIDYGQSKEFESHRVLTSYNMYMLEHVALPASPLPPKGFRLIVLPMKIRYGTGAPCRVIAVPYDMKMP